MMRGLLRLSKISRLIDRPSPRLPAQQGPIPSGFLKWAAVGSSRGSKFASGFTPLQPKPLDSIMDVERAKNRLPEDLVSVWDDFHLGRGHIGTSMKAKLYYLLQQRSVTGRHFVIPLWRGSGYTNMFIQVHIRGLVVMVGTWSTVCL